MDFQLLNSYCPSLMIFKSPFPETAARRLGRAAKAPLLWLAALVLTTVLLSLSAVVCAGEVFLPSPASAASLEGEVFLLPRKKAVEKEHPQRQVRSWPPSAEHRSRGVTASRPDHVPSAPLFILAAALLI